MRKECEDYLKERFLNMPTPEGVNYKPTDEDWALIPKDQLNWMIDLVLDFNSAGNPLLDKIMSAYNNKAHSDISFGMEVKSIIYANKPK